MATVSKPLDGVRVVPSDVPATFCQAMARQPRTLAEIAAVNLANAEGGGAIAQVKAVVRGAQVVSFLWMWAYTMRKLGRAPTRAEQGAEWKQSEREVYRDLALFRKAFPTEEDPNRLADWMNRRGEEQVRRAADALRLLAPSFLSKAAAGPDGTHAY